MFSNKKSYRGRVGAVALATVVCLQGFSHAASTYSDAVVAIVGDTVVTLFDVVRETYSLEQELRTRNAGKDLEQAVENLRRQAATQIIERELVFAEFKRRGFEVPFAVVEERLDAIVVRQAGGNRQVFADMLAEGKQSLEQLRQQLIKTVAVDMYIDEFVRRQVQIAPADVEEFYRNNHAKFQQSASYHLQMIMLKKDGKFAEQLQATTDEILAKIAAGAEFADLAKAYSEDASAATGGDLGWITEETGNKQFLDAVRGLKPGRVAKPLEMQGNMILLRVIELQPASLVPLQGEVAAQIETHLRKQLEQQKYVQLIEELKQKTFVKTMF